MGLMDGWSEEAREAAQLVIDNYDEPHEATDSSWRKQQKRARPRVKGSLRLPATVRDPLSHTFSA
jgi:hypothetical protein